MEDGKAGRLEGWKIGSWVIFYQVSSLPYFTSLPCFQKGLSGQGDISGAAGRFAFFGSKDFKGEGVTADLDAHKIRVGTVVSIHIDFGTIVDAGLGG
jgi:hypothetical protein